MVGDVLVGEGMNEEEIKLLKMEKLNKRNDEK